MGLLDDFGGFVKTPEGQGLLSAIAGGLAGARRGAPINSLGVAGLAGLQGYSKAQDNEIARPLKEAQLAEAMLKVNQHKKMQEFLLTAPPEVQKAAGLGVTGGDLYNIMNPKPKIAYHEGNVLNENMLTPEGMPTIVGKLPEAAPKPTSDILNYQFDVSQGYKGNFNDWAMAQRKAGASSTTVSYGAPVAGVDPSGNPIFFQPSKDGKAPSIVPGVAPPPKDAKQPTEFQGKAGLYFKSMEEATKTLDKIETEGNPRVQPAEVLAGESTAGNVVRSKERQQYVQAQRQWVDSINRVRSGANLPEMEYGRAVKTFFPEFGDSPETIKQKTAARKQEEQSMSVAAGPAAPSASPSAQKVRKYNPKTGKIE